ncbi:M13 family metallopeptidase [Clostridium uliginosum]|uniref:Putative endopeptidase n=1 Tax=Clostridium uliginosum TaxID=119641 RepID=A0A1I1QBA9_9CLOT|nr:M13 family metallopeptidase [Clostridium uliginosum]SFD16513.1 putative endopeptidase [Clostridium uliginosum]
MRKFKKTSIIACALVCSLFMSQATYVKAAEVIDTGNKIVSDDLRLQDDFYSVTNKVWLNSAKIDAGNVSNSAIQEANKALTEQKKEIMKDLLANEKSYAKDSDEKKIINLYKNILNTEARNKQGIEPIKEMLSKIDNIKTLDDVRDLNQYNIGNPIINIGCGVDLKDATRHVACVEPTSLSLGDSDEYVKPTENTARIKGLIENYYNKLLTLAEYTPEQAKTKVDNLFKLEYMIASSITGKEENSKNPNAIDDEYNVYTLNKLDALAPNLKLKTLMKDLKMDKANKIILTEPKWLKALNDIYTEENLPLIRDYIEIKNLDGVAGCLGEDFQKAQIEFSNAYFGSKGEIPKDEKAISGVNAALGVPFGKIYVEKYFSKKTKENVENMTDEIIKTYENRIKNLDWMSEETKKSAIEKLNKLSVQIGYPEKWADYSKLEIRSYEEGGSLWENMMNLSKFVEEKQLKQLNEPVDKSQFACLPQTINAFYNPTSNTITVPAGILQGEFYKPNASKEVNLGAIGSIIGHEISHAFDNTGAKFDADGNLNSWWSTEDYKKFEEKTNKVRNFYNSVKADNGKNVNGDLTVGENIADIGGIACALDILNKMPNANYKDFFESNATLWRRIDTKEYADIILKSDEHSPNKVRANIVLSQFDKFYETYGIKENDKMYIKVQDRLQIW